MADEETAGNSGGLNAPAISLLNDLHSLRTKVRLKRQGSRDSIGIFQEEQKKFQEGLPKLDELEKGLLEAGNDKAKEDFQEFCKAVRNRNSTVTEEISKLEAVLEEVQHEDEKVAACIESFQKLIDEEQDADEVQAKFNDMKEETSGWVIEMTKKLDDEESTNLFPRGDNLDIETSLDAWTTTSEVVKDLRQELAEASKKSESKFDELKKSLEESETQATLMNETICELKNEVNEVTSAKKELELNTEELKNEIKDLAQAKSELESNNGELKAKVEEITAKRNELESISEDLKEKLEQAESQAKSLNEQNEKLESEVTELTLTKNEFASNNEELESRIKEISSAKTELESNIEELKRKLEESESELNSRNKHNDELKDHVKELNEQNEKLESEVKELTSIKNDFASNNEELEKTIKEISSAKTELESNIEELKRKLEESESEFSSLDKQNDGLKDKIKELDKQNEKLESEVKGLTLTKNDFASNNEELEKKIEEISSAKTKLESKMEELKKKLEESESELNSLDKQNDGLKHQVKELTVAKERSESQGEDLKIEVRGLALDKRDLESECDELKRRLTESDSKVAKLEKTERQVSVLENQNDEMQVELLELKTKLSKADKLQRRIATIATKLGDGVESDEEDGEPSPELERIQGLVGDLKKQLEDNKRAQELLEKYESEEKERSDKNTEEMERLLAKIESNQSEKAEQGKLVDTIKGLLDENEKLAANLEEQNKTLSEDVLDERQRVSELRGKVAELQRLIDEEKQNKHDLNNGEQNMKNRLEDEKYRHENSLRKIEDFKHQIEDLVQGHVQKEEEICKLEVTVADTSEKLQAERRRNEENEQSLMELHNQIVLKENLLEVKESGLREGEKKVEGLEKQLEWLVENNKVLTNGLQESQRKVEEFKLMFEETNSNKESERYLRDEYAIRCDMLVKKLELTESESAEMAKCVEISQRNLEEEREKVDLCEKEIDLLTEELQSEKNKSADNQALNQDLQEQVNYFEALNEYNHGIKSSSIENIMEAEQENERLQDHIAELMDQLGKKDSAIEELVANYAMEEQVYKQESEKDKQLMDRLRAEIQELRLREIDCERIREKESELCQVQHKLQNEKEKGKHLEEQIARLEDLTKLENETGDWRVGSEKDSERTHDRVGAMKAEYQKKKLQQKDEEIQRLAKEVDELYEKLKDEQRQVGDRDIIIFELNAANRRDLRTIEKLNSEVQMARQQAETEKRSTEEMTARVEEGQKLITELETMAERERTRAVAMEEVLSSEKGKYNQQMGIVKDLKKKVEEYQKTVGEVRTKVDRINRHMHCGSSHVEGPRPTGDANVRKLNEKLSEQKTIIRELKANLSAVEEKNESLTGQIQEQKGKNVEQDAKLEQLLGKSSDSEYLMTDIKSQLEEVKARYQGLSWELQSEEEEQDSSREDLTSPPPQSPRTLARYVRNIPEQALSKQLARFENLFENIFCEEAKRMEELQSSLQGVMNKNTEFAELLLQIKCSLDDEKKKGTTHRTELEELESKLRRSEVQIDNLITAVEKEGSITRELHEEIRTLRQQKDEKEDSIRDLRDEMRTAKDIERKLNELKGELQVRETLVEELNVDLETERKCYKIVSERLQSEQNKNCELENKMCEFENLMSSDKETFEQLRYQADSENTKSKRLLEEMDIEKARAVELEDKIKELEEHIAHDLELFDELRETIEREKEQSRKLDSMLQEEKQRVSSNLDQGNKAALDLEERLLNEMKRSGELQAAVRQHQDHNYELEKMNAQLQTVVQENKRAMSGSNKNLEEGKKRNEELCERVKELQEKVLNCKEQIQALLDEGQKDFQTKHDTQRQNEELKKQLDDLKKDFEVINDNKQMDISPKLREAVKEAQKRLKKATAVLAAKENVIQKSKQKYDKQLAEKETELRQREKSLVVLKKALEGLRSEKEREEASRKACALKVPGGERQKFADASEIIKDLEKRIQKLKEEVQSKTELGKVMKEDITELRSSQNGDAKLLKRKENLHRVVLSEVEENEKKRRRLEKLHDLLVDIFRTDDKRDTEDSSDKSPREEQIVVKEPMFAQEFSIEAVPVAATSPGRLPTVVEEVFLPEQSIVVESIAPVMAESPLQMSGDSFMDRPGTQKESAVVYEPFLSKESTGSLECGVDFDDDQFVGELGFDEFDKDLFKYVDSLEYEDSEKGKASSDRETDGADSAVKDTVDGGRESRPPSYGGREDLKADSRRPTLLNWRIVLGGIVLTVVMLLLQHVLPQKAFGILSALLFLPITILVSRYERKRLQKEMNKRAVFISGDNQDLQRELAEEKGKLEELMLLTEGDARVIQELRSQLEEELAEKEGTKHQLEEVKVDKESLLQQERTIENMSGRMRQLEKASIDGAEKQTQGFEEYKTLKEEIDKLRRHREEEMKKQEAKLIELEKLPLVGETKTGWRAVKKVNLPIASLPVWIGVAVLLYHLSGLHVVAPYVIFCSLMLVSANAWYTIKRWSKVLEEERRISTELKEELDEVMELLDREYDVVKAQKSAIDMLVEEIEEEQASRKAKQVALAKLIWQLQEMEGMQTLVLKERRHEAGVKDWQSTMRQVAQEKATEKAKTYSSIISQLKEIGAADTAEEDDMTDDLCEAAKELTKYAEEQIEEVNKLHVENAKQDPARAKKLPLSWRTIAIVTLNTVTLGAALIFKSYIAAAVFAVQAVLYAVQRRRTAARLGSVKDDVVELKQKLVQEIERNKIQQVENEKLKKLLRTAGRYKRSDEFAMEVKERCKKRAQQRQP